MSTYTDYKCERKENLTVLRKPGCECDGITGQRVIFANEANIYKGTFDGNVIAKDMLLNDATLTNPTINGGTLVDVNIQSDGQSISITELTSQVSNYDILIGILSDDVSTLKTDLNDFNILINSKLSTLSDELSSYTDEQILSLSNTTSNLISSISSELTSHIDYLSTEIKIETGNLQTLSDIFINHIKQNENEFNDLHDKISERISSDEYLSSIISSHTNSINDIQKNIQGGLNYQDNLCIDIIHNNDNDILTLSTLMYENIQRKTGLGDSDVKSIRLREGFFYILESNDPIYKRRVIENVELEHGDWLIIKENTLLSDLNANKINVFNAQDYDSFRLSSDNIISGDNTFYGKMHVYANTHIENLTATNISASNSDLVSSSISNLTATNISASNLDLVSACISNLTAVNISANYLSINLDNLINTNNDTSVKYSNVSQFITSVELSVLSASHNISALSNSVSALSTNLCTISSDLTGNINYLSSELLDYHNTLSGIDRATHDKSVGHTIPNDNLMITDISRIYEGMAHPMYYMTMLSGTLVLKPINK